MTDPQLVNNNNQHCSTETSNNFNNNNHDNKNHNYYDGEAKYRHKKFKKMATSRHLMDGLIPDTNLEINADSFDRAIKTWKSGYVCPHCKISCAKPSVLQKHVRAHTNERPYPCMPCGIAFKTKSNLYKHCRSRAHTLKVENTNTVKVC